MSFDERKIGGFVTIIKTKNRRDTGRQRSRDLRQKEKINPAINSQKTKKTLRLDQERYLYTCACTPVRQTEQFVTSSTRSPLKETNHEKKYTHQFNDFFQKTN